MPSNTTKFAAQDEVRRLDGLIEAAVDDEILALHVEQGVCYGFNVTAAHVWASLREPKRVSQLKDALLAAFDVDAETCERELHEILGLLEAQRLIAVSPLPAASRRNR